MGSEDGLVEIRPRELQFLFEVKMQSSCSVHLVNKTDEYVSFKVKTTSPKRYCVQPNTGVILPRATCDFTVTMQAQRTTPPDLQIKDKFLVQTTVVPFGTSDEGIVPAFFSKESGRYIEENKLRVVLVSATQPKVEQLINGVPNAKTAIEFPVAKETSNIVNEVPNVGNEVPRPLKASFPPLRETAAILSKIPLPEKETPTVLRDFPIPSKEAPATSTESALHLKQTPTVSVESHFSSTETNVALKESSPPLKDTSALKEVAILSDGVINAEYLHLSHVTEDVQNLESKLNNLKVKLEEAENLIIKLREGTRTTIKERDKLWREMDILKRKGNSRSQAGSPLLFVIYIAILGVSLGYLLHL